MTAICGWTLPFLGGDQPFLDTQAFAQEESSPPRVRKSEQMPTVMVQFVQATYFQATFVHKYNLRTNCTYFDQPFGTKFIAAISHLLLTDFDKGFRANFFSPKLLLTRNFVWPTNFLWINIFRPLILGPIYFSRPKNLFLSLSKLSTFDF